MNFSWKKTASTVVSNTVVETSLLDPGIGSRTLQANSLYEGCTIRVRVSGYFSTTATPTLRLKVKLGAVLVLDTTAVATASSVSDGLFELEADITCRSLGATGTVFAQGTAVLGEAIVPLCNITTATIDTEAANILDITCTWGTASASNTVTATNAMTWLPLTDNTVNILDFGAKMDDSIDDAPKIMDAIEYAQLTGARVVIPGTAYIRTPIIIKKVDGNPHRFVLAGITQTLSVITVSSLAAGILPAMILVEEPEAPYTLDNLVFQDLNLKANGNADYGIDCRSDTGRISDLTFDHIFCENTKVAGLASSSWAVIYNRCNLYYGEGDGILCDGAINNGVSITNCVLLQNRGVGIKVHAGTVLNITGCILEQNNGAGILIGGGFRTINVIGNYFELNAKVGHELTLESGGSRIVRADVIVNGYTWEMMSLASPSFELTAAGNRHLGAPPAEYAYYVPGLMGGRIDNNYHAFDPGHPGCFLKLVGFYGNSVDSRPQNLVIGLNSGFTKLARIDYSGLTGSFTVGEYVGRRSESVFTALGRILSDDGSRLYIESQNQQESFDIFAEGNVLESATVTLPDPEDPVYFPTFTLGSAIATATMVSYRPKSIWVDGGVMDKRPQRTAAFREEEMEHRNFFTQPLTETPFEPASSGGTVHVAFTGSNTALQMDTSALTTGDRIQIHRDDGQSDKGVKNLATYYGHVVDTGNLTLHLTEADAIAWTGIVVITGDIGTGHVDCWNGTLSREEDRFMGLPAYKLSRKLKGQNRSGWCKFSVDLGNEGYERLCGRLVYFGCWIRQSDDQIAVRFNVNGLNSRDVTEYSPVLGWKWQEWYAEMPYSGTVHFTVQFTAPAGDATNRYILIANPILSLVGVPYTDYGTSDLLGAGVSDPAGGSTVDIECRAQLSALLAQLRAIDKIEV
jgi:hypothetical protein